MVKKVLALFWGVVFPSLIAAFLVRHMPVLQEGLRRAFTFAQSFDFKGGDRTWFQIYSAIMAAWVTKEVITFFLKFIYSRYFKKAD